MEYDGIYISNMYNIHWCLIFFLFIGFKTSKFIYFHGEYTVSNMSLRSIKEWFCLFLLAFYWAELCVISDILIECIGFPENFTKLLEKSYRTTYFINKIEKTFRRWLQHFCRQLNRTDSTQKGFRLSRSWEEASLCLSHSPDYPAPGDDHSDDNNDVRCAMFKVVSR